MAARIDLLGKRFGRLVVLSKAENTRYSYYWMCQCDCGNVTKVDGKCLRHGRTRSCGCLRDETAGGSRLQPYESLYNLFKKRMLHKGFDLTYTDFVELMSDTHCHYCSELVVRQMYNGNSCKYMIDRKDNSIGYTKENCVTCCTQCNFAKGNRYTYSEWVVMTAALKVSRSTN